MPKQPTAKAMETTCPQCQSRFRLSALQLRVAGGQVKCGECEAIFDARQSLKGGPAEPAKPAPKAGAHSELSLHEAMYGERHSRLAQFAPVLWLIGILLLATLAIAQAIYYQRYPLIENPRYQKQVLNLCRIVPCDESQFSSNNQIKMLERNVFTHPLQPSALMVTGSFVNQASFDQKLPKLLVTLFDIQGNIIANRLFSPAEYLQTDKNRTLMQRDKPVQFRLEISDPGTSALTYEFEFL